MIASFESLTDLIAEHGVDLLIGSTIVMAFFATWIACTRSAARRHRLAGTGLLACAAYLLFAAVPLPRFAFDEPVATNIAYQPPLPTRSPEEPLLLPAPAPEPAATAMLPLASVQPTTTVTTEDEPTIASPPIEWSWWFTVTGLLIGGAFALQIAIGWLRLRRVLKTSSVAPTAVRELVDLPPRTRVRIASMAVAPFCCGLLRPTIVLPAHLADVSPATRFVLLHERAHLVAGDTSMRMLAAWLRPLLFWHPLYWWLQRQLRFTGELLADDAAAGRSVADYVRCMMTLAEQSTPSPTSPMVATVFRRRSELFRRLEMMLTRNESLSRSARMPLWLRTISAATLVALCAGTFGVERAVAQDPQRNNMRAQIAALQDTIATLRAEIADLQHLANQQAASAPAASRTARQPSNWQTCIYTIRAGDTLAKISKRFYGSVKCVDQILRLNPALDARRLQVGSKITVERCVTARAQNAQGQNPLATTPAPRAAGVASQNGNFGMAPRANPNRANTAAVNRAANAYPSATAAPTAAGSAANDLPAAPPSASRRLPTATTAPRLRAAPKPVAAANAPTRLPPGRVVANTNRQASGSLAEIVQLVSHCIELDGDCDVAEIELKAASRSKKGDEGRKAYEIAKSRLRTKKRQRDAVRSMLRQHLTDAENHLAQTMKLHEKGFVTSQELNAAKSRVNLLQSGLR